MILTLYARAPLLCVWTLCVCALHTPEPSVVRATEVSLAQTEIAFITLYEPASTTARVLSRLAVAAHHATTHGLGPPVATNQWRPRAKRAGRAVARDQTARLSAGKVLSRVHCDHLDHGCSPRRLKIWVRGEGAVHARKRLWGEMRAAGWVIGGNVGRGEFLPRDILLIGYERLPRTRR